MGQYRYPVLVKILNIIFAFAALLAVVTLIFEYGFHLSVEEKAIIELTDFFIIIFFVIYSLSRLLLVYDRIKFLRRHWFNFLLVSLILIQTIFFVQVLGLESLRNFILGNGIVQISKLYIVGFQILLILSIISHGVAINRKIATYRFHPLQILLLSFLIIILIGTGLLMLPRAVEAGKSLSLIDALFTSASATCVTGLIVVDTGTHFSMTGQLIILFLIQIGALGIMSYASFFALLLGRNISLRERLMMRDILNYDSMDVISRLLTSTVVFTMFMEVVGAVLLFIGFQGHYASLGERIYSAVFHSISAFCNAGFSLHSSSLTAFNGNYLVVLTVSTLIIFGGLGFPVIVNLFSFKFFSRFGSGKWLTVQTRMVLGISGILIFSGLVFYFFVENSGTLSGLSWYEKILNAYFQSVTTRTAGFNTVDTAAMTVPTSLFFMVLMFIGASPGSTGGGIKTTTLGVLTAGIFAVMKGRKRIEMFHKNIPYTILNRSMVIFIFSIVFVTLCIIILSFSEQGSLMDISFEAFSAFGTVGLSRGITASLSLTGKIIITLLIFFGRLGALTISLAITGPREAYHYQYPSENVMVG